MNREQRRSFIKRQKEYLIKLNLPKELIRMDRDKWPESKDESRIDVFISQKYMVQIFKENKNIFRLSINKTVSNGKSWEENLSWDELQTIKNEVGYKEFDAVEVYPKYCDVVNVANMRHLFVMPNLLDFAWRKNG